MGDKVKRYQPDTPELRQDAECLRQPVGRCQSDVCRRRSGQQCSEGIA